VVVGLYLRFQATAREQQLAAVRAEQRAEFARDLHDFIAHHVTGIVVQAQGARYVAGIDPGQAVDAFQQIEQAGAQTMSAMRRMVGVLRQGDYRAPLAPPAGLGELAPLIEGFAAVGGPEVRLSVDDDASRDLPVEVATSAYRVVMEALTNVRKHAGTASTVEVGIHRTPEWLFVRVVNDGPRPPVQRSGMVAFDSRSGSGSGFGLVGLAERVGAIGGRLRAGPGIDGGWVVDAALPLTGESVRDEGGD
jgi:signal transduction histidine kinase